MEQMSLDSNYEVEPNFKKYNGWILTVGELKKTLATWDDDTLIELSFRGRTPMGSLVDVSMPISNIGVSSKFVDGEKKNLIYLDGADYDAN